MTEKELKRLNRRELLEMLIMQSKKIDRLQAELDGAQQALSKRELEISESGSIAEASIKVNNVFTDAQRAAEQYLENIHRLHADTEDECKQLKEKTVAECKDIKENAEAEAKHYVEEAIRAIDDYVANFTGRLRAMVDMSFDRSYMMKLIHEDKNETTQKEPGA